jgi:hypothetical protein
MSTPKQLFHSFPGKFKHSRGIVGVIERVEVTLTSAQIKALFTTPQVLVPAPGAGRYIQVLSITGKLKYGTIAYTGANAVELRYTDGSGTKVTGDLAAAWLNATVNRLDTAIGAAATSMTANAAVVVAVPTANPAAGDSTVQFDVLYRVMKGTF